MILIDQYGNATSVLADAVAISFDGSTFLHCTQGAPTIDLSGGTFNGWGYSCDPTNTAGFNYYTSDGGATWTQER